MERRGRSVERSAGKPGGSRSSSAGSSASEDRRRSAGRGSHGRCSSPGEIPLFMRLSGEAAEQGRRSRSRSNSSERGDCKRSRQSSPAPGVASGSSLSNQAVTTEAVHAMAEEHVLSLMTKKQDEDLSQFGGRCYWCLQLDPDHLPSKCAHREHVDVSEFEQRKPHMMKKRGSGSKARTSGKARAQTTRSAEEQKQHEQKYKLAWQSQTRDLERKAKGRAAAFTRQLEEQIHGHGPFGQYTLAQLLSIEFAQKLSEHLSPEMLERDHSSINSSAVQRFAALLLWFDSFSQQATATSCITFIL